MANTKKYVSLDKLGLYDEKIKAKIAADDATTLASAKSYADGLAVNYDAAGSAATAEANAKAYADGKDAAIAEAKKAGTDAAAAAAIADGKAVAAQGEIDALEAYVGTFTASEGVDTVVKYIDAKTANIASDETVGAIADRVGVVEGKVATIEGDYLKAADKTELEGEIGAVQTAVDTEKSRAEGIEAGLRTDIDKVMGDYLKAADKTELQGNIDTVSAAVELLTNGVDADKVDGVNDLIKYVEDHGAEFTGIQEDVADNAEAIAGVAGRMDTAEGKISGLEGSVATKAEKTYVDEQVQQLGAEDAALDIRMKVIEAKFIGDAEGSVQSQIADAKAEAIAAAAADATTKANTAESNAKGYADGLNNAMNDRVEALEAVDHDHSNKTVLDGITSEKVTGWDNAAAKVHEHSNLSVLEGITSAKVTAWDAAEGNAKTFAQGLNDAVSARVTTLETWHNNFTECSEDDINGLFA